MISAFYADFSQGNLGERGAVVDTGRDSPYTPAYLATGLPAVWVRAIVGFISLGQRAPIL